MYDQHRAGKLDEIVGLKSGDNLTDILSKERFQMSVCDIPCRHEQELVRQAMQRKSIDKIRILSDDNDLLSDRKVIDLGIPSLIPHGQIERMRRLVSQPLYPLR